jgi:hypothetical protein
MALVGYSLQIDTLPGESQEAQHKDEIQVLGFSFGEQPAGTRVKHHLKESQQSQGRCVPRGPGPTFL